MFALFSFVRFCFHVLLCRPVPARTDSTHNTPISPFLLGVIGKLPIPTPTGGPVLTPVSLECIKTWPSKSASKFTVAALFHKPFGAFIAVLNTNELVSWSPDSSSIADGRSFKLSKEVQSIHRLNFGDCVAVLFADGSLQLFSSELKPLGDGVSGISSDGAIHSAQVCHTGWNKKAILCACRTHEEGAFVQWYEISASLTIRSCDSHVVPHPRSMAEATTLVSMSFDLSDRILVLSWSDAIFGVFQLANGSPREAMVSCPKLVFSRKIVDSESMDVAPFCVYDGSRGCVAVGGLRRDGAPAVSFWSTKYGVVVDSLYSLGLWKSDRQIAQRPKKRRKATVSKDKQHAVVSMYMRNDKVVISLADSVWLCAIALSRPTLASCLGRLHETAPWLHEDDRVELTQSVIAKDDHVAELLKDAIFSEKLEKAEFKKAFNKFWKRLDSLKVIAGYSILSIESLALFLISLIS